MGGPPIEMWSDDVPLTGGAGAWSARSLSCLLTIFQLKRSRNGRLHSNPRDEDQARQSEEAYWRDEGYRDHFLLRHPPSGLLNRRTWRQVPRFFQD